MSQAVKTALVGYGFAGKTFHAPLIESVAALSLRTVVSSSAAKVHADLPDVQVVSDATRAFADPDIQLVVIATPNNSHFSLARAALEAGKHVVVDKPFTLNLAEGEELAALADAKGLMLSIFHNRRWDADFLTVSQLLHTGTLGQPVLFESHADRYRPQVRDRWRERAGAGAGLWYDLGPHLVDQALQLFGLPVAVFADIGIQRAGGKADDYFQVLLRYPVLRVILHGSLLSVSPGPHFRVLGTEASYLKYGLDKQEASLKSGRMPGTADWGYDPKPGTLTRAQGDGHTTEPVRNLDGDYRRYYSALAEAIITHNFSANPVTPAQALEVMTILDLARMSAETHAEVALNACVSVRA